MREPSDSDWGTCLYSIQLNLEMKVESLFAMKVLPKPNLEYVMNDYMLYDELIEAVLSICADTRSEKGSVILRMEKCPSSLSTRGRKFQ